MSGNESPEKHGSVLIAGGGIGGMQAALDLAEGGYKVYIVQKDSAIGGTMARLDKTFPTGDCAMCMLSPKMVELSRHPGIELLTLSEVKEVSGEAGNFVADVWKFPRFVDPQKCTGCGHCEDKCPRTVKSEFEELLTNRKAIYALMAQAVPNTRVIDEKHCIYMQRGKCRACEKFCEAEAIDFQDTGCTRKLQVGAIILSPGLSRYDPTGKQELGFGRWPNVVTSLQFERMLSASGPYLGEIKRPGDEKHPDKIAWIQCVGSRDPHNANPWCSSVCCMYATKQAVIAKEHDHNLETSIFYIDMRAYGKDFDKYVDHAQNVSGVRYIRGMISQIEEEPQTSDLKLSYMDVHGKIQEEVFGMVVLSVGLKPRENAQEFAETFGIQSDQHGFPSTWETRPLETSRTGIYVSGTYQSPKDIPETVLQGSAAASHCMSLLSEARNTEIETRELPPETDVSNQSPRVGVFICHCGINIAQTVDVQQVVQSAKSRDYVEHAEDLVYACSQDSQERIKELAKQKSLNRIVVASCTPRTHEPLFQDTIRDAGLNRYLFELANIREQCSWCHMEQNQEATSKAVDIVNMHINKICKQPPISTGSVDVTPSALIIGGGIAGITAALSLGDQEFSVHLLEQEDKLGGMLNSVYKTLGIKDVQSFLQEKIQEVYHHPYIRVYTNDSVKHTEGFVGNFNTILSSNQRIEHGASIIAVGGKDYQPEEYAYEENERVITQRELGEKIKNNSPKPGEHYIMIQCVGSREKPHNYCSRICCQEAIRNAISLKESCPECAVSILYRDIRTYGLKEYYYSKARHLGVMFIRYTPEMKPEVEIEENGISVKFYDYILNKTVSSQADYLILSTGIRPHPSSSETAENFKLTKNEDGFFLESHVKLAPVDFPTEGIFLAGLAHAPKNLEETISQAQAAAGRAGSLLSKEKLEVSGTIATHDPDNCMSCLSCLRICPYGSPYMDEDGIVRHNEVKCMGCGLCAGVCPGKAFQVNKFRDDQILAMIDAAATEQ